MSIKILDCTLRDGGYVNNWMFGRKRIKSIIKGLTDAGTDIIECGFIRDRDHQEEQSLYRSIAEVERVLPANRESARYVAMMESGSLDVTKLREDEADKLYGLRNVFHEHQAEAALEECRILREKGYGAFLQPMGTDAYSDKALLNLLEKANEIDLQAFYFVDSLGVMNGDDVTRLALLLHNNLNPNVALGFHTHNNLQLAFSNVQKLINMRLKRDLILDSSIFGMGRGAGNLHTELIANYLNENLGTHYNVDQILRTYDEDIRGIHENFSWGYSVPYYLAAVYKCHPNYGTYLANRETLPVTDVGVLLSKIPSKNRRLYSEKLIEEMYTEYMANKMDDTQAYAQLKTELLGRPLLLLGPGKSLVSHADDINAFIKENKPIVVSINHVTDLYPIDFAFYSNRKRFEERPDADVTYILTSNVTSSEDNMRTVDYTTLSNQQGKFFDNAAVMLFSLLWRLGCDAVAVAGLDGYSGNDYYEDELRRELTQEWKDHTNAMVSAAITQYSQNMKIEFITPSRYKSDPV